MSILDTRDDLLAFRLAVRGWLSEAVPKDWAEKMAAASDQEFAEFQRWWMLELAKVGLATPHWPVEYGGAGLGLEHQIIMAEESARANSPAQNMFVVSKNHVPNTLIPWGSEYQKRRYLPTAARGVVWCQGFSEPNAGSDLASLKTRAILDGDHYVVNGQKIWSSYSVYADYCILLTRTDVEARKHAGITFFILDMHAPGVEVRPIRQSHGKAEFAELFLNDVKIPVEDRVGEENRGWTVAQSTLASERGVLAFEAAERQRFAMERFYRHALEADAAWLKDAEFRREFMVMFADMQTGRRLIRRLLWGSLNDRGQLSTLPSVIKITGTVLNRRLADFKIRIGAAEGQLYAPGVDDSVEAPFFDYLNSLCGTIAAGTNEIQRNIIAERGLNMPREIYAK